MVTVETCSGCQGTGKINCPVCNGRGRASKRGTLLQTMECPECRGIGKLVCSLCGGVGKLRDRADKRPSVWRGIFEGLW
jgi:DnaJ-class molecular chaperone